MWSWVRQEQRLWGEKESAKSKEAEKGVAAGGKDGKDGKDSKDGSGAGAPDANGVPDKPSDASNGH